MPVKDTIKTLLQDGFILVFNQDALDVVKTAEALIAAGINNMEVTCRIAQPLEKIRRLAEELPDFVVGAASLIDYPEMLEVYNRRRPDDPLPTIQQVVGAGAKYIVSAANFCPATYKKYAGEVAIIPGCGSVSEIAAQFSLGANFVKIFPARELGGPGFVKAIDPAIHKLISLVPTGGTSPANIPEYISAGVLVLGGSFSAIEKVVFKEILARQDYNRLAAELTKVKQQIDELRSQQWGGLDFSKASVEEIGRVTGRDFNLRG